MIFKNIPLLGAIILAVVTVLFHQMVNTPVDTVVLRPLTPQQKEMLEGITNNLEFIARFRSLTMLTPSVLKSIMIKKGEPIMPEWVEEVTEFASSLKAVDQQAIIRTQLAQILAKTPQFVKCLSAVNNKYEECPAPLVDYLLSFQDARDETQTLGAGSWDEMLALYNKTDVIGTKVKNIVKLDAQNRISIQLSSPFHEEPFKMVLSLIKFEPKNIDKYNTYYRQILYFASQFVGFTAWGSKMSAIDYLTLQLHSDNNLLSLGTEIYSFADNWCTSNPQCNKVKTQLNSFFKLKIPVLPYYVVYLIVLVCLLIKMFYYSVWITILAIAILFCLLDIAVLAMVSWGLYTIIYLMIMIFVLALV